MTKRSHIQNATHEKCNFEWKNIELTPVSPSLPPQLVISGKVKTKKKSAIV